jgi:hypothetical protein
LPLRLARGLLQIAEDPKARVAAYRELLDRGWGKAPTFASIEGEDPLGLSCLDAAIQTIADELRVRRQVKTA